MNSNAKARRWTPPHGESARVRHTLITVALLFLLVMVVLPIIAIFTEAFSLGFKGYLAALSDPDTLEAVKLTLIVSAICVPLNTSFGLAASWAIAKFHFPGKQLLITLIDLPFSVSPVVVGFIYILLYGIHGLLGRWLDIVDIQVIFAVPGIVLVTMFVTMPFVARELIPLMQEQGAEEEEAALLLGATGWKTFRRITVPNVKWGLLYGILLCNARAMGEFGAVSVVSGHIRGVTTTLPLMVEILYNEYNFVGAFASASMLAFLAILTLILKSVIEWRSINTRSR